MLYPNCPVCGFILRPVTLVNLLFAYAGRPGVAPVRAAIDDLGPQYPAWECTVCEIWHCWG